MTVIYIEGQPRRGEISVAQRVSAGKTKQQFREPRSGGIAFEH
jgi:hypothetical protein